ncbi:hypothetical protein BKA67DRAFT_664614 [Truncatella angustata]|uniref:Uncharacterized protein n=1 Tax=Truncatella angustata TaxID=152316 RepID=A0A9P8RGF8_9PEZI|nr:uncharacterized protein BKA67DRAFT_664614 [Truncatella angustata]KAH6645549.1 hypothetical protein BKA67DRAFT_664614 [Truncatella angustata]
MPTTIKEVHDRLSRIDHVVVCIDPVDLDNIWLCLWALVRVPSAQIHIVLSPRVLDLRVPNFGDLFGQLIKTLDSTFQNDPHTREHIPLYMALFALRFLAKILSKNHDKERIVFYWDWRSMDTIVPCIHHPTHVLDMLYACNKEECQQALGAMQLRGPERKTKLVAVMEKSARRLAKELGYQTPADVQRWPLQALILGGGPFTEMPRLLAETALVPIAIVAMARTWFANVNIFPNNYNDMMDLDASINTELIKERAIPTWIFPTECAKAKLKDGKVVRPCALDFSDDDTIRIFRAAGDMESYDQAVFLSKEIKTLAKVHMFDVLTVVPDERLVQNFGHCKTR